MRRWIRHMRGMAQGIGRRKTRLLRRLQLAANGRFVLDARDLAERLINRPLVSLSLFFSHSSTQDFSTWTTSHPAD